ncbi:MAG: PAS domain S-box protein [Bacteroidota bacterium]|nr:PAS domain S-box protein [Bacteroidota bacterium]
MKLFATLSLQQRVFLFGGTLVLTVILVLWLVVRPKYEASVIDERLTIVQQLQSYSMRNIDQKLEGWTNVARYVAWQASSHPSGLDLLLRQFMILNSDLVEIKLSSPSMNDELVSRNTDYEPVTFNVPDTDWLPSKIDTTIQTAQVHLRGRGLNLAVLRKHFSFRNIQLVVTVVADAKAVIQSLANLPLGDEYSASIVGPRGVVFSNHSPFVPPRMKETTDNISRLQTVFFKGNKWRVITAGFHSANFWMVIALPEALIVKPVRNLFLYSTLVVAALTSLVLVFGWFVARQISKPVSLVVEDVEKLSALDFTHPVRTPRLPELQQVGKTIETMRQSLERYQRINVEKIIFEEWKNRFLMSYSEDMIAIADSSGRFVFVNDRFSAFLRELDPAESITHKSRLISHPHIAKIKESLRSEKSGSLVVRLVQSELKIADEAGKPVHFSLHDVAISKENEDLGSMLIFHDLTNEREIDRMKTDMINIIVHELRSPLSGILGFATLMFEDKTLMPAERTEYLGLIVDKSHDLNRLVNRFLDIQRLESGAANFIKEEVDLSSTLRTLIESQKALLLKKSLIANFVDNDSPVIITAVPELMREAFVNLLTNAVKYGDPDRTIDIVLTRSNENVIFSITDYGYGIAPEDQTKVFTKFFRGISNPKAAQQIGTGLGLAHVKEIVAYHKGSIRLESNPELGCRFTIVLPRSSESRHEG